MNQWDANYLKFILPEFLTSLKIQNMHLKQPYGELRFVCDYVSRLDTEDVALVILEIQIVLL